MSTNLRRGATDWGTAAIVKAAVQNKWDRGALLRDLHANPEQWSAFPLRVRLPGPDREALPTRFAEAAAWARELAAAAGREGWQLQTRSVRAGGTTQVLPVAAVVPTPHVGLALLGRAATVDAARFSSALQRAAALDTAAAALALARPHDVLLAGEDWPLLLELAAWIRAHPRPGVHVRQIPVAGVHTKVLERHTPLLTRLLLALLPPDAVDPSARAFASRFGFVEEARRVRIRGAGHVLGVPGAVEADVEWDIAALAALDPVAHGIHELLVTENKTSFRTVPARSGRLVVWGAGYGAAELLSAVQWRHDVAIIYWGDIDTHGFAILSALRAVAPHTTSVLMDAETLLAHKPFWSREHAPRSDALPHLLPAEAEAYDALRSSVHGSAVRLEQEFIRFDLVEAALGGSEGPSRPGEGAAVAQGRRRGTVDVVLEDELWRSSPTAPCGCAWDGYQCPHCGSVTTHSGDAWEPRHTLTCHRRAERPADTTDDTGDEAPRVDDHF